jgi:hypothetical protein
MFLFEKGGNIMSEKNYDDYSNRGRLYNLCKKIDAENPDDEERSEKKAGLP